SACVVREDASAGGEDDRRRAFEHGVGAGKDDLSRGEHLHLPISRAPPPGRASKMRRTPSTEASLARTTSASPLRTRHFRCGPASIVAYVERPSLRMARTASSAFSVAPETKTTPAAI